MDFFTKLRLIFISGAGLSLTFVTKLIGGFDISIKALLIVMGIDFISGLFVGLAAKSLKTESGGLNSKVGFVGLLKKIFIIMLVVLATVCDLLLNIDFVRMCTIYAFIANELLSVAENAGLLGVPFPEPFLKVIDVLHEKDGEKHE